MKLPALTLTAVRFRLGVSYSTAYALVSSGRLRAFRAGLSGAWRVDVDDLEQFIESRKTTVTPAPVAALDPDAQFDNEGSPFL